MKIKISSLFAIGLFSLTVTTLRAQVAINNTAANPNGSAILDLNTGNSGDKGFLAPQVTLLSNTDITTILAPATGLMVYVPSGSGLSPAGYYYWNGSTWTSMGSNGSGTNNFVARWISPTIISTGKIQDNGLTVAINSIPLANNLLYINSTIPGAALYSNSTRAAGDSSVGATTGVYGYSTGAYSGVQGASASGFAVSGQSSSNIGIYGSSISASGIYGFSSSSNGIEGLGNIGVLGSGAIFGGNFSASHGQGVSGTSSSAAGDSSVGVTYGVYGNVTGAGGSGVYGNCTGATGIGVYGTGPSYGGVFNASGAFGWGVNGIGTVYGGYFQSVAGTAVYGTGSIGGEFTGSTYGLLVPSGFVGIGCNTPAYTLDVSGNIRATGSVYYGGTGCIANGTLYSKPDYVFEPDYKKTYTPIEVEKFITEQGHLPWVTSAEEDKKENKGAVDITRMSFQTLEAVENTQMQIIEQQKTIISQQAQIDKLNKQVSDLATSLTLLLNKQK